MVPANFLLFVMIFILRYPFLPHFFNLLKAEHFGGAEDKNVLQLYDFLVESDSFLGLQPQIYCDKKMVSWKNDFVLRWHCKRVHLKLSLVFEEYFPMAADMVEMTEGGVLLPLQKNIAVIKS